MIQKFLEYEAKVKNLSQLTLRSYEKDLTAFSRWLLADNAKARWSSVDQPTIERYIMQLHDQGKQPSTIRRKLSSIRAIYKYFVKKGMMSQNPARYIEPPKMPVKLANTIDDAALRDYMDNVTKPLCLRAMVATIYETGMRISEVTELTCEQIDWQEQSIRVTGKGAKERIVYFGEKTAELLGDYAAGREGLVWIGATANQRRIRYALWEELHEHATNGKASPHTIRHSFATRMLTNGCSLPSLQALLGHQNVETTRRYARLNDANVKRDYRLAAL